MVVGGSFVKENSVLSGAALLASDQGRLLYIAEGATTMGTTMKLKGRSLPYLRYHINILGSVVLKGEAPKNMTPHPDERN